MSGASNTGITLSNVDVTVTTVDARGMTGGAGTAASGFNWTSGALTSAATINGSVKGGDVINAAASTKAVTIIETAGTNTITGSSTIGSTLTGGSGADTINGGAGNDVIVGGNGADIINGGGGADQITVSGNTSTIVLGAGSSGFNTATNTQPSELVVGFDIIRGVVAGDKINLGSNWTNQLSGSNATDLVLAGTNLAGTADKVVFAAGTLDVAAGTFTFALNGADTAVTYDSSGLGGTTSFETVILVGFHVTAATAAVAGLITLG